VPWVNGLFLGLNSTRRATPGTAPAKPVGGTPFLGAWVTAGQNRCVPTVALPAALGVFGSLRV
jgi:hypothetical protein